MTNQDAPTGVSLALLSHTNVGKTTLARTLLRRDIGAVMDRAHVTEVAESHVLMTSTAGDELVLWDTPGFGDSVRLLRRLERSDGPIGWFLSQVWDRFADRPFWCSQQALRTARDSADVLLYVLNATETPASAGYVAPELAILGWLDKPALVLLNQLGTAADPVRDASLAVEWTNTLAGSGEHRRPLRVLSFDAFARCWLQEHTLLAAIHELLEEPARRAAFDRLRAAWRERDGTLLERSASVMAGQLAATARDAEHVEATGFVDKARGWLSGGDGAESPAERQAQERMLRRLDTQVREATARLVTLHGLTGSASEELLQQLGSRFSVQREADADKVGLLGGLVTGALSGLAADLAAGGLTFGAGALLGGLAGAIGARKLTQRYNAERGITGSDVRWSEAFLEERLAAAMLRYLAVAHFGRGRGEFQASAAPARWVDAVDSAMRTHAAEREGLWTAVRADSDDPNRRLQGIVQRQLRDTLEALYPEAAREFDRPADARRERGG
jgi:hypothetical protein